MPSARARVCDQVQALHMVLNSWWGPLDHQSKWTIHLYVIKSHRFASIGWDWILRVNFLFSFDIKPLTYGPSMKVLDDLIGLRILDKGRAHPNLSISHLPTPRCGPIKVRMGMQVKGTHVISHWEMLR